MPPFSEKLIKIPPLPFFAFSYTFYSEKLLGEGNFSGSCSGTRLRASVAAQEASNAQSTVRRGHRAPPDGYHRYPKRHRPEQAKGQVLLLLT